MTKEELKNSGNRNADQLSLELRTPIYDDLPIYIAGTFNNWNTADERFRMHKTIEQSYVFNFPIGFEFHRPIEYKYVRGGWDEVELDEYGNKTPNRVISNPRGLFKDIVPKWSLKGRNYKEQFLPKIQTISERFEIPQLIKTRRITALLPHNYDYTERRYPVLYLQDGQNLFDESAPFGNWGVDKKLAVLAEQGMGDIIIIAIDHAESERVSEFTPSVQNAAQGSVVGKKYVRFLADTLKPYIDKHFRTLPDSKDTGIGGSSMGGLISIYAGFMYPEVYSKLMIFSPSLWKTPHINFNPINFYGNFDTKIYLYAGAKESATMLPNAKRFQEMVTKKENPNFKVDFKWAVDPEGTHSEYHWGAEFPKAIEWLFFED